MKLLIRNAKILGDNNQKASTGVDILIVDGVIQEIKESITAQADEEITGNDLHVCPGFVDLKADVCDPGFEHKETVQSALDAAAAGGYTRLVSTPNTQPPVDSKATLDYLYRQGEGHVTAIHPAGTITEGLKGENLAQLYDLYQGGVRLFSDDTHSLNAGLVYRALLYTKNFGGKVMCFSKNESMSGNAQVNEGQASLHTGLKAYPAVAEWLDIERNLNLLEYTQGSLHLTGLSSSKSVELVRIAKKKGLNVTADVHVANLLFTEEEVFDFDTNHKVLPCLRAKEDQVALWEGLKDNTIDAIVSDHRPNDTEEKDLEFDLANFGSIQLQTAFIALLEHHKADLELIINKLGNGPRAILGLPTVEIKEGIEAELTIFDTNKSWVLDKENIFSQVYNSAHLNQEFSTKICGVVRGENSAWQ